MLTNLIVVNIFNIFVCQNITLYTLNLHNVIGQLDISKLEKNGHYQRRDNKGHWKSYPKNMWYEGKTCLDQERL